MTYTKAKGRGRIWVGLASGALTLALLLCMLPRLGAGAQNVTVKISVPDVEKKLASAVSEQQNALPRANYQAEEGRC